MHFTYNTLLKALIGMRVKSVNAINPSVNTTKKELQERIDYKVNETSRLEKLAKINDYEAMKQFIVLKNYANNKYRILTLQKMKKLLIVISKDIKASLLIYILLLVKYLLNCFIEILMNFLKQI